VEDREKDLNRTLTWMRNKDDKNFVKDSTSEVRKIDSILPMKPNQSPDDRAEEIEQVLDWLRTEGVKLTNDEEPTSLNKIGMPPMPPRRTPEERAKDLHNVMTWARNMDNHSNDPTGVFKKLFT
jgi:hypothetical protein